MTRRVNDQIRERMPDCLIAWLSVNAFTFHSACHAHSPCHLPVKCAPYKISSSGIYENQSKHTKPTKRFSFSPLCSAGRRGGRKMRENVSQFIALSFGFSLECLTISFHLFSIALFTFSAFQFVLYLLETQKGWPRIAGRLTVRKGGDGEMVDRQFGSGNKWNIIRYIVQFRLNCVSIQSRLSTAHSVQP